MIIDREVLLKDLRAGVVEVHFTKVDGTSRVMKCTLSKSVMPPQTTEESLTEEKKFHRENPDVLAVWDIEKLGWRSFRLDSVSYVQQVHNY